MGESMIQQYHVREYGRLHHCKSLSPSKIMTFLGKEAPANFVPAAAVIRRGLALLGITGRKGRVGGSVSQA